LNHIAGQLKGAGSRPSYKRTVQPGEKFMLQRINNRPAFDSPGAL
jgi:hypothetical protein